MTYTAQEGSPLGVCLIFLFPCGASRGPRLVNMVRNIAHPVAGFLCGPIEDEGSELTEDSNRHVLTMSILDVSAPLLCFVISMSYIDEGCISPAQDVRRS